MGKLIVLAYNFPHRKTQDFLLRLFVKGYLVDHVLAADPVTINTPASKVRSKVRHLGLLHPKEIADSIGATYHVIPHSGPEINALIKDINPEIGIISGARILPKEIIQGFSKGIINLHPGLIPECRGLDALLWAINNDIPLGVTSHLIDEKVDAGRILERRKIKLYLDDTIYDLSERLYEVQLEMLEAAIDLTMKSHSKEINFDGSIYNRRMNEKMERDIIAILPDYLSRHCSQQIN